MHRAVPSPTPYKELSNPRCPLYPGWETVVWKGYKTQNLIIYHFVPSYAPSHAFLFAKLFQNISPLFPITPLLLNHLQFIFLLHKSLQLLSSGPLTSLNVRSHSPMSTSLSFILTSLLHFNCWPLSPSYNPLIPWYHSQPWSTSLHRHLLLFPLLHHHHLINHLDG